MSKKAPLFSFKYLLHDILKWFMSWQLLLFWRIKAYYDGQEAKKKIKGGAVIVSNHVAFVDPFVTQGLVPYRRFHFIASDVVAHSRFGRWFYKHVFLTQLINRDAPSIKFVQESSKLVKNGNLVCLFPEGHINTSEKSVDDFKGGAVLIAYKADAPIIPIYHLKRKTIWNRTRMVIGKPINVKEMVGPRLTQDKLAEVAKYIGEYTIYLSTLIDEETRKKKGCQ